MRIRHQTDDNSHDMATERMWNDYFRGKRLYGDDFGSRQVQQWFEGEREAYYDLIGRYDKYEYAYHALNWSYGFRFLPSGRLGNVLGIGSAFGEEFGTISARIDRLVVLESSARFATERRLEIPVEYVEAQPSGELPFPDDEFDIITIFGTLHHIPNVSMVMSEVYRCLSPGGYALIREPIVSLGDWRKPREGLTPRERGIPLGIFRDIILSCGFRVVRERKCGFSLVSALGRTIKKPVFNSRAAVLIDRLLCSISAWNTVYHPSNLFQKIGPTSVFYVLMKNNSDTPV